MAKIFDLSFDGQFWADLDAYPIEINTSLRRTHAAEI